MKKEASLFNHLIQPIRIGSITIRNRMVQPGMGTNLAAADGTASDAIVDYYARRAQGGVGLIITEVCCPEPRGRVIPGELEISSLAFLPSLSRLANAAHAGGAKIALQLAHGGCFASQSVTGHQPISPSGVGTMLLPGDTPRAMTVEEIHELVEMYGQAALRARMAGFDAVEIHGAHGYMPLQFLSGYTNRRTDEYGGSFENRSRFALEVIAAIKRLAGPDFTVIYRLSAEEDAPGGVTLDEAVAFARLAEQAGVDALNISAGTWDSRMHDFFAVTGGQASADGKRLGQGVSIGMWVPPHYVPRGNLVELAATVKKAVKVPVIAVCGLTPLMAEEVIAKDKADLTAMGRQILADISRWRTGGWLTPIKQGSNGGRVSATRLPGRSAPQPGRQAVLAGLEDDVGHAAEQALRQQFGQLQQPAFHHRHPAVLAQQPQVGGERGHQVQRPQGPDEEAQSEHDEGQPQSCQDDSLEQRVHAIVSKPALAPLSRPGANGLHAGQH